MAKKKKSKPASLTDLGRVLRDTGKEIGRKKRKKPKGLFKYDW